MKDHILEFSSPGSRLSKRRGHLIVSLGESTHEVPLDDIFGVVIVCEDVQVSTNALVALLDRGIAIQFCNGRHMPSGMLLPYVGHQLTRERQLAQISLSNAQKGRLWQKIITSKIKNQAVILELESRGAEILRKFAEEVRPMDESNMEGQAARLYWRELFGEDFRRDVTASGINSFLNYGYAIVRSAVARYAVASGLNPAFGLFHRNMGNPFCLVDDLMEPFRPLVDRLCIDFVEEIELTTQIKRTLVDVLEVLVGYQGIVSPLRQAIQRYCQSFASAVVEGNWRKFNADVRVLN